MSMTSREVFYATVRGEPTDRSAVAVLDGGAWQGHHSGQSHHDILASEDAGAALSLKSAAEWGSDVVYVNMAGFGPFMEAMGCDVDFSKVGQAGTILSPAVENIGEVDKLPQTPEAVRERALANEHVRQTLKQLEGIIAGNTDDRMVGILVTGPFTFAGQLMTMDDYIKGVIRKPKDFKAYVEWATMAQKVWIDLQMEIGGNFVFIADPLASADVISPKVFNDMAKPALTELISHIKSHNADALVAVHMCGHTTTRLEGMKDTGIDVFSFDKNDYAESRQIVDGAYALFGNVGPSEVLLNGTPEDVAAESAKILDAFDGYHKFILAPGCDLAPATELANIQAMSNAVR